MLNLTLTTMKTLRINKALMHLTYVCVKLLPRVNSDAAVLWTTQKGMESIHYRCLCGDQIVDVNTVLMTLKFRTHVHTVDQIFDANAYR